jgi:squalene-hopene/tetraprenyl-beta-curcumene cyclase
MKTIVSLLCLVSVCVGNGWAQGALPELGPDVSLRQEIQRAIERGLAWLEQSQNTNGYWSTADHPALTALALIAFKGDPAGRYRSAEPAWVQRAYAFILECRQPDGGIHRTNLANYNTALSLLALLAADKPAYTPAILQARRFLIGQQIDLGEKGKVDTVFDGGVGYGSKSEHSDMSNTLLALEALHYSRRLAQDQPGAPDLNWPSAIHFLQNCQNLPGYNPQDWVSDDPKDKGGFVYFPGQSMAGARTNAATGRVALRSYGSISYAGMLSYIYADLKREDPRVLAVYEWLRQNYTLEENPGLGAEGLFYYFHTMSKALTAYGAKALELGGGRQVNWRRELGLKLLNCQQRDGSWFNEQQGRWWEKDPALVTAYCVHALELIYRGM